MCVCVCVTDGSVLSCVCVCVTDGSVCYRHSATAKAEEEAVSVQAGGGGHQERVQVHPHAPGAGLQRRDGHQAHQGATLSCFAHLL